MVGTWPPGWSGGTDEPGPERDDPSFVGPVGLLPDAGHYLPFERPEQFAAALLDWLTRV